MEYFYKSRRERKLGRLYAELCGGGMMVEDWWSSEEGFGCLSLMGGERDE